MVADSCILALRKAILSLSALSEKSLSDLTSIFEPAELKKEDFFCREGNYPLYLAFICQGIYCSYYQDKDAHKFIRGFFIQGMFLLPLPPYIYRKPSFLNFQALNDTSLMQAKYTDLQALMQKDSSLERFMRGLINSEWIVNRELFDAGLHLYNAQTRCHLFTEQYQAYITSIPREYIMSYLNISAKQFDRFLKQ